MQGYERDLPPGRRLGIYSGTPAPPGSQSDTTTDWTQFVSHSPTIINPKKAALRLASLRSDFVRAGVEPLIGAKLGINETGGHSEVVQFRSNDAGKKALGMLGLEQYAPCPQKCDFKTTAVTVPNISGAKGYRRSGHAVDSGKPFTSSIVLFSDGPFVYVVAVGGNSKQVDEQRLFDGAKKLHERTKGHPAAST